MSVSETIALIGKNKFALFSAIKPNNNQKEVLTITVEDLLNLNLEGL